jgi:transposase
MEQLDYNFLFRWFVGLNIDDPVWDVTVFTKNRERLLVGEVEQGFFNAVVEQRMPKACFLTSFLRSTAR